MYLNILHFKLKMKNYWVVSEDSFIFYHCALTDTNSSLWVIRTDISWSWGWEAYSLTCLPNQASFVTTQAPQVYRRELSYAHRASSATHPTAQWADSTNLLLSRWTICSPDWGAHLPKFVKAPGLKGGEGPERQAFYKRIHAVMPSLEALIKCLPCAKA